MFLYCRGRHICSFLIISHLPGAVVQWVFQEFRESARASWICPPEAKASLSSTARPCPATPALALDFLLFQLLLHALQWITLYTTLFCCTPLPCAVLVFCGCESATILSRPGRPSRGVAHWSPDFRTTDRVRRFARSRSSLLSSLVLNF